LIAISFVFLHHGFQKIEFGSAKTTLSTTYSYQHTLLFSNKLQPRQVCFAQTYTSHSSVEEELSKIVTDFRPNVEERKKFETLRNEKAELRRRVRQLEEEINNRHLEKTCFRSCC